MEGQLVGQHYCALLNPADSHNVNQTVSRNQSTRVTTTCHSVSPKPTLTYAQACKSVRLNEHVCRNGQTEQVTDKRSVVHLDQPKTVDVHSHEQPVVDDERFQLVYRKRRMKQLTKTTAETLKGRYTPESLEISTCNRFECLQQEVRMDADDEMLSVEDQQCESVKQTKQQGQSAPLSSLDQSPEKQETLTVSPNSRKREMTRMRQQKLRQRDSKEQATLRRLKVLECLHKRRSAENKQEKLLRRQKSLDNVRSRLNNETEQERLSRRQKALYSFHSRLNKESQHQRQIRLQKNLKNIRHRLLAEDVTHPHTV